MVTNAALEAEGVGIAFGGVRALSEVRLRAAPGEIVGIIGPNGAGKSTLFNVLTGFLRPDSGVVRYYGREVSRLSPDALSRMGLVRTWQTPRAFQSLTVRENIAAAAVASHGSMRAAAAFVDAILDETGLRDVGWELSADLPPAFRKRLEVARALARSPRVLLLDEVMAGLTFGEIEALFEVIRARVARDGLTVVLIEHVIRAVRALCGRVVVLSGGRVIAEGSPAEVMEKPVVVEAYLGRAEYLRARVA